MKPLTHFKKTKILRNIFLSLGAIFALVTAAHAQNLYVSANVPGGSHVIFEYTPTGTQSTYATGLDNPRGLAFDSIGNLFATTAHEADNIEIDRKSTRLNSSHANISYAVFCLKKKKTSRTQPMSPAA